ncbi:MAG: hypothetical protein Q9217_000589 [Psora testacea]
MSNAPLPSSFDGDADFYNENRWQKFTRRVKEEPLIPFGIGLTCWALVSAARSIRKGDGHRTNRYFRYRLYAQAFTIVAMLGGSYYYNADRLKRNEYVKLKKHREAQEKRDAWIRELEARDAEDKEWRAKLGTVRDAQREEVERGAVEEMRARKLAKAAEAERGASDDGRGVIAAIRQQANASKIREERIEGRESAFTEEPGAEKETREKEKPKSLFGESEAGGLFGFGHLKDFWNSRNGRKPDDGPKD